MSAAITTALPSPAAPVVRAGGARGAKRVLPGFGLTLGYALFYLCLIVLVPLSALVFKTFALSWEQFWTAVTSPRVLASYRLTFGASFLAALVNLFAGYEVTRDFRVDLRLENIFDVEYVNYLSAALGAGGDPYLEPGFNAKISATWRFGG